MKNLKSLLFALTIFMVSPLFGQSTTMKANIPFNFTIDNRQMPAGDYEFRSIMESAVLIRSANGATERVTMTESVGGGIDYKSPSLEFEKRGDEYILSAAFFGHSNTGRQFARSKQQAAPADRVVISQAASN